MTAVKKAVFPVAGSGTRFLPATKALPKEMLPIIDKPLIQYAVEEALASGIEEIIFVTGRGKTAIEDHFDRHPELERILEEKQQHDLLASIRDFNLKPGQISYVRQQEPLGLGHAVWCARHAVGDEPFAVLLADDFILSAQPCLKQLQDAYQQAGGHIVAAVDVALAETQKYGIIDVAQTTGRQIKARGVVEKPRPADAPSTTAIIGRYILDPSIFSALETQSLGKGGEIQLTDAISKTLVNVPLTALLLEGNRYDCGNKEGMLEAIFACALARDDMRDPVRKLIMRYT